VSSYTIAPLANAEFIDACATGTALEFWPREDSAAGRPATLPFPFRVFGADYTSIWPHVDGIAELGGRAPQGSGRGPVVAPYWTSLALRDAPASNVCVSTVGTAPNRRFVIEWRDAATTNADPLAESHLTFQAVLHEGTNTIDFLYRELVGHPSDLDKHDGRWAFIGVHDGLHVRFARHRGIVMPGAGLRLTPVPQRNP
jgi:hypothetical protein